MADFKVKAVHADGISWPVRSMLQSLDSPEVGEAEWWRRMALLQNAAACADDGDLLRILDKKKKARYGTAFDAPELVTQNNLPPLSVEESIKRWFQNLSNEEQTEFLNQAMSLLIEATDKTGTNKIFSKKQHWMAVYMVLSNRLGMRLKQNEFHIYAARITPDSCPVNCRITSSTMTNYSKTYGDAPYPEQRNMFWAIIKDLYYSAVNTND